MELFCQRCNFGFQPLDTLVLILDLLLGILIRPILQFVLVITFYNTSNPEDKTCKSKRKNSE